MTEPMHVDERYHRGPCPVPTPTERKRVRTIVAKTRAASREAARRVVAEDYAAGLDMTDIALRHGITRERVRQLLMD